MARAAFILALCLLAGPGLAGGRFAPPAGCVLDMTVQNHGCTVTQHLRCDSDAPGDRRSVSFDRQGRVYDDHIDAETRWLDSTDAQGLTETLLPGAADDASFSTLIATGHDSFDFWTELGDGTRIRYRGSDRLTGQDVTIDGVTLARTQFRLTAQDANGAVLFQHHGGQYVSRAMGRFFGGSEVFDDGTGQPQRFDHSPARFDFPDEPGFGSTTPEYDCDMIMAQHSDRKATL
ncbi:hypothetical protein [Paracoccus jiaweipingae]|uniref:hypothetical protein n=1 Tax=unclassified Paracoccus (in: a-proteobacteria) TaxID=2688777 RepID=UPI00378CA9D7